MEFHGDRSRGDGFSTKCKGCDYECQKIRRERFKNRTPEQLPDIASKQCSKCGETKSVTEFYPVLRNKDGYSSWCKTCFQKRGQAYHKRLAARRKREIPSIKIKRCPKCGEMKPVSEFYKAIGKVDGYTTICKGCNRNSHANYTSRIADREFEDIRPTGKKRCWMCKRHLPVREFNYSRTSVDGLASHCRECGKEYKRQHYEETYGDLYNRQVEYRQRYPERRNAFAAVHEATYKGRMVRPDTCSKCGESGYIVAHHDDYNKPLDIRWLCLSCDRQLHAELKRREKGK